MNFPLNTIDGQSPRPSDARAPVTRVAELQDTLNRRVYHPLALRLARRLAATPVTPNMVSVAGGLTVVMAAAAYAQQIWPRSALVGLPLHMGWHVVDAADGDLARMAGRSSLTGELVDGAEGDPMRATAVRATIRRDCADAVTALTPPSANYRTLVLGVSMIAGSPIYYLLFEALVLNLVLAASIRRCNAAIRRAVADLAQPAASNPR